MTKRLKYIIIVLFITALGALFYNKVYVVKSTFELTKPSYGDLLVGVKGIGNVSAKDIYEITAQSGGKIEEIYFDEGEWVKKGELLLKIDPLDLPMLLEQAEASLKKAKMQQNALTSTKESLKAQKELLGLTHERYKKLLGQKFVTQAEYDKAKSDLDNITAQMSAVDAEISSATYEAEAAQKNIEAINTKLSSLNIYSPTDGYITLKNAQKAQYVLPSLTIFKIVDPKTLWVEASIDERAAKDISLGQLSSIKLRSAPKTSFRGEVARIFAMSDLVTLERKVAVKFDEIPKPFYMNEQAEINIMTQKYENVLKIPLGLLRTNGGKKGVWVAKGDRAAFREVEILAKNNDEAAILRGIASDEELIIDAADKKPLRDGMKIFR